MKPVFISDAQHLHMTLYEPMHLQMLRQMFGAERPAPGGYEFPVK